MFGYGLEQYTDALLVERQREVQALNDMNLALQISRPSHWRTFRLRGEHVLAYVRRLITGPSPARHTGS